MRPWPSRFLSGRGPCPRLQLRGSAGFAPASLSLPSGKDARSELDSKEQEEQSHEFNGRRAGKSTRESSWCAGRPPSVVRQTDRRLFIVGFPCDPLCPLWLKPLTSSSDTKTYAGSRRNITITIFDALHQVDRQALPNASIFQLHREPRTGLRLASRQMSFLLKSKVDPFSTDRRFVSL
jgi:hypothetical protein